ncbi:MAG: DUF1648 domain-containing protein [Chitinophagaceae bacterium]|jgi:uncharacterized membrane protein
MQSHPKLKIELSATDKAIEVSGYILLVLMWALPLFYYSRLPEIIPIHFNAAGKVDGYGIKATIFLLPAIGSALFAGLKILNRFPHIHNYAVKITTENALKQYTNSTRLVRLINTVVLLVFAIIVFEIIQTASGKSSTLGIWFLPFTLLLILVPVTFFTVKSFSLNRDK